MKASEQLALIIEYTPRFKRALKKKTPLMKKRIKRTLQLLGVSPWYPGLNTHKVRGTPGVWEFYVNKASRVTWEWAEEPSTILLRNNCNHDVPKLSP